MTNENDLWPSFDDVPKITSPVVILKEQASILENKTKGIILGKIGTGTSPDGTKITNYFSIVAPLLKNYSYRLFSLTHGAFYYPLEIQSTLGKLSAENEESLKAGLKMIFNHDTTIKLIYSLIGQSKDFEKNS